MAEFAAMRLSPEGKARCAAIAERLGLRSYLTVAFAILAHELTEHSRELSGEQRGWIDGIRAELGDG